MTYSTASRLGLAIVVSMLLLLGGLVTAYAEGDGVISGKVTNMTPGGGSVAGLEVSLQTYAHQAEGGTAKAVTDQDGNFRFEKLVTANNFAYRASVEYLEVAYSTDLIIFKSGELTQTADLQVFESIDKPDALVVDRAHIILGVSEDTKTVPVMEILIVVNESDRVLRPSQPGKPLMEVTVPDGATGLQLAQELANTATEIPNGFALTEPMMPGANEILYSYELPYNSDRLDVSRSFQFPVKQVSVLMPDTGIKLSSPQLETKEPRDISGQKFAILQGAEVPANSPVLVHIEGLPVPSPISAVTDALAWAKGPPALIGLAVVAVAGVVFVLRRRSASSRDEESEDDDFADDDQDDFDEEDDEEEQKK